MAYPSAQPLLREKCVWRFTHLFLPCLPGEWCRQRHRSILIGPYRIRTRCGPGHVCYFASRDSHSQKKVSWKLFLALDAALLNRFGRECCCSVGRSLVVVDAVADLCGRVPSSPSKSAVCRRSCRKSEKRRKQRQSLSWWSLQRWHHLPLVRVCFSSSFLFSEKYEIVRE